MKTVNHFYLILIHGGEVILQVFDMYVLQADIDAAVKALLVLKAEYKSATGKDWKPRNTEHVISGGCVCFFRSK